MFLLVDIVLLFWLCMILVLLKSICSLLNVVLVVLIIVW